MRVHVHFDPSIEHHAKWGGAFLEGLKKHGVDCHHIAHYAANSPCDMAVMWSFKKKQIVDVQNARGLDYLILERGYIDRMNYTSASLNGLHNLSEDYTHAIDKVKDGWVLKRQKMNERGVCVIGQVPNDASLFGECIQTWAMAKVREFTNKGIPVVFRPHPLDKTDYKNFPCPINRGSLSDVFKKYRWICTFSSTVGVDAVIEGLIASACHPCSMIYNYYNETTPDKWLKWISHRQWNKEQFSSGYFWDYFRAYYEKR